MYLKHMKYNNSCFPCALQMALVNVGNLPPTYGDKLEDDFNRMMADETGFTLNQRLPDETLIFKIIPSLGLPLGKGFLVGPKTLSGCEQACARKINDALAANENVAFVIGKDHAVAVFKDSETGKWYRANPSPRNDPPEEYGDNISARGEDGSIVLSSSGRNIYGGHFVMMVSQEH
jgi:hypothetical protein